MEEQIKQIIFKYLKLICHYFGVRPSKVLKTMGRFFYDLGLSSLVIYLHFSLIMLLADSYIYFY